MKAFGIIPIPGGAVGEFILFPFVLLGYVLDAVRLVGRSVRAALYVPIVFVDERASRINLQQVQRHLASAETNLAVARIGDLLCSRGRSEEGRQCIDSVIRAVLPKPVEIPADLSAIRGKK